MATEVVSLRDENAYRSAIDRAASCLAAGGLVAFPTETVYGVGASAASRGALERLRSVKNRPADKPFTVHIPDRSRLSHYVPQLGRTAQRLTNKAWPGPLTVIFEVAAPTAAAVLDVLPDRNPAVLYRDGTIGVRCPDHPVAVDVLMRANVPIVAASANRPGQEPPIAADQVVEELDGHVDLILDGGTALYARASTIVRLRGDDYEILREGVYDDRMLRSMLRTNLLFVCTGNTCRSPMAEAICRRLLAEKIGCSPGELNKHGFGVQSAGSMAMPGGRISEGTIHIMQTRGLDVSNHQTQPLTHELIHSADYIYVMCESHRDAVVRMNPGAASKIRPLDPDGEIDDPVGGDDAVYDKCAKRIEAAVRLRLEETPL